MRRDGFEIKITGLRELERSLDRFARDVESRFSRVVNIPVQLQLDDDEYLDRACPAAGCREAFKVMFADFEARASDDAANCVLCGHTAEAGDFATPSQLAYLQQAAVRHVDAELADAARAARLDYRPGSQPIPLTPAATEVLLQRTTCAACGCRYATLGSSYFCHACGHRAAVDTFAATMRTVRDALNHAQHGDLGPNPDAATDIRRFLIEGSLQRAINAFEAYAGDRYQQMAPSRRRPGKNAFQNLERSGKLWRPLLGRDYADMLTTIEYRDLARLLQQRHLSHIGGIVDQEYLDKTGETEYRVGQRLVIKAADVERLVTILEKLAAELR